IRLEGSPAREHHREVYGGAPYDAFLDDWQAEAFDPDDLVRLFARAGAKYVVPTSKHHDGIALWDAPGTGTRNTVHRGPRRDLVEKYAPDVLWNDIEWPDAGKHEHALGLAELFGRYYDRVPDGVVNDRWGDTHWDFRTSEYQASSDHEAGGSWENNRGIGLS